MRWLSPADDTVRATCPVRLLLCRCVPFAATKLSYITCHICIFMGGSCNIYLFIYFSRRYFGCCGLYFPGRERGKWKRSEIKKIKKSIWTETTALNKRNTFEVCLLICSLLHWNLASKRLEIMRPRGELNGTSQPIFFLSPREKRASIPPFVVQTHLPFLFQSFPPFSPFTCLILLSVSFTSPRHSLRLTTKLISLLLSLKAPPISSCPYSSPSFFFHWRSTELLHFPFFRHSPPHFSSSLNPGDWSPLLLISPPPSSLFPLSSPVSLRALLQRLCLVCQPVKLLRYSTSCW